MHGIFAGYSYGCHLSATVQKPSASGYAYCCSSDASQVQAERGAYIFFSFILVACRLALS